VLYMKHFLEILRTFSGPAESLEKALQRIQNMEALEENWDGQGAEKISMTFITMCQNFLRDIYDQGGYCMPHSIEPSPDSSIIMSWLKLGAVLELEPEVENGQKFCWFYERERVASTSARFKYPQPVAG